MALNEIFRYTHERVRERPVPSGTTAGTPLLINTRPCVAITARADATKTFTLADGSSRTIPVGSAGQSTGSASVAFDGTFEFTGVTGVTSSTTNDTPVYITSGGALTLTSTSNTLYGYIDMPVGYSTTALTATKAPVRIASVN